MKQLLYVLGLVFGVGEVSAQPGIEWQKCLGGSSLDEPQSSQPTSDGGYIIAGYTLSNNGDVFGNHGGYDAWVCKLDESGNIAWKKAYGGSNHEWIFSIQQTTDGGFIMVGLTYSNNGNVSGNHGDRDVWLVKLSSNGVLQWQKCLGGSAAEDAYSVIQTTDGGYILVGRSNSNDGNANGNHGDYDVWVVKLSNIGVVQWQKMLGGSWEEVGYSIKETLDGGYVVTGESFSIDGDLSDNHGNGDYWVLKLNSIGEIQWEKALGGTYNDVSGNIILAEDGGYLVVGQASSGNGDMTEHLGAYDIWLVKLSSTGLIEWQKSIGGSSDDWASFAIQSNDGGYILAAATQSTDGDIAENDGSLDAWVLKINGLGEIQWEKTFGGSLGERGVSISHSIDGGLLLLATTWSNNMDVLGNHGDQDFWVVKLSPESPPTTTSSPSTQPLTLSPNPAQNTLSIQTPEPGKMDLQIHNLLGQSLWHQSLVGSDLGTAQVDISLLPKGLYLVSVSGASGRVYVGRFLKGE